MATREEIAGAYAEWRQRSNANARLKKMVRGWDRVIHFATTDTTDAFTVEVVGQELSELTFGHVGTPDVIVTGSSEDFCDMFWGDLNPSEKYMSGEIILAGSQHDVMRIDAISMVAFLDQGA
jgi:putative sterol carrier protein